MVAKKRKKKKTTVKRKKKRSGKSDTISQLEKQMSMSQPTMRSFG